MFLYFCLSLVGLESQFSISHVCDFTSCGRCRMNCLDVLTEFLCKKFYAAFPGQSEVSEKIRCSNHKSSFRDPNKRLSTELSKHIWHLKDAKIGFSLTWKILKQAAPFNPASNSCNSCLWKKYFIICRTDLASLNKRNELVTSCRHARKFLLSSFTSSVGTQ